MDEKIDLSEFIIVGVDIMKAFNYLSRGPQDPTRVDWAKQLHGGLSARHRLHINTHHWLVYNKHTHTEVKKHSTEICKYCPADEINFLLSVLKGFLSRGHDIPRGTQTRAFIFLRLDTTSGSLKKHCVYTSDIKSI